MRTPKERIWFESAHPLAFQDDFPPDDVFAIHTKFASSGCRREADNASIACLTGGRHGIASGYMDVSENPIAEGCENEEGRLCAPWS